jgi:hypothetical protein
MASMTGSPGFAHAVIVIGSDLVRDDLAATYHRVGGAHPTMKEHEWNR